MNQWKYEPARDLGLPLTQRARSLQRESGLVDALLHRAWWAALRVYLRLRFRLRVVGREHLPAKPPFVLIANHASHLDALVMGAILPRRLATCVFPIAAGDVFFETRPLAVASAFVMNLLPMWRHNCGPHALKELRARLVGGDGWAGPCGFILFPEGKRSRDGELLEFKAGLGMLVAGADVPIVPCWLEGAFEAWPPGAIRPRGGPVTVHVGAPLNFKDLRNRREGWQQIADDLRHAVEALRPASTGKTNARTGSDR